MSKGAGTGGVAVAGVDEGGGVTIVDRFICRREGHKPSVVIRESSGLYWTSYITTCLRCGKAYEVTQAAPKGEAPEADPEKVA
jgi:hypothetical protein